MDKPCPCGKMSVRGTELPTPITHLAIAKRIWSADSGVLPCDDAHALGAFLVGSTLPDVRVLSSATREATHFLELPPNGPESGVRRMFQAYPHLKAVEAMDTCARLMIAGYIAHLLADEIWLLRIYWPYFQDTGGGHSQGLLLRHDLLRTEVDRMDRKEVPALYYYEVLNAYDWASPPPFISDQEMGLWRRLLLRELRSTDSSPTCAHFAGRHGLPVKEFIGLLDDRRFMAGEVWSRVPAGAVSGYHAECVRVCGALVSAYLSGAVDKAQLPPLIPSAHSHRCDAEEEAV